LNAGAFRKSQIQIVTNTKARLGLKLKFVALSVQPLFYREGCKINRIQLTY